MNEKIFTDTMLFFMGDAAHSMSLVIHFVFIFLLNFPEYQKKSQVMFCVMYLCNVPTRPLPLTCWLSQQFETLTQ